MPISQETRLAAALVAYFLGLIFLVGLVGHLLGVGSVWVYVGFVVAFIALQNLAGPSLVERTMKVEWRSSSSPLANATLPLATAAKIPLPRVGVSKVDVANAFAFGRTKRDGRVCVTEPLENLLVEGELSAVLAHEVSHVKNWDMTIVSLLSVVPILSGLIAQFPGRWVAAFDRSGFLFLLVRLALWSTAPAIWSLQILMVPVNWLSTLLMCYASRASEMAADRDAVSLGAEPFVLASALFRISRHPAEPDAVQNLQGARGLLLNSLDSRERASFDLGRAGHLDKDQFLELKDARLSLGDMLGELFGTHPTMIRRLRQLARLSADAVDKANACRMNPAATAIAAQY
jgi:heat shock protein HtpX